MKLEHFVTAKDPEPLLKTNFMVGFVNMGDDCSGSPNIMKLFKIYGDT